MKIRPFAHEQWFHLFRCCVGCYKLFFIQSLWNSSHKLIYLMRVECFNVTPYFYFIPLLRVILMNIPILFSRLLLILLAFSILLELIFDLLSHNN